MDISTEHINPNAHHGVNKWWAALIVFISKAFFKFSLFAADSNMRESIHQYLEHTLDSIFQGFVVLIILTPVAWAIRKYLPENRVLRWLRWITRPFRRFKNVFKRNNPADPPHHQGRLGKH